MDATGERVVEPLACTVATAFGFGVGGFDILGEDDDEPLRAVSLVLAAFEDLRTGPPR